MKKFGYWKAIYLSFYSRELYRDVAKNWSTGTLLYLLLVLTLSWIVMMFSIQPIVTSSAVQMVNKLVPQFPVIIIENGVARTLENRPYVIKDPENNDVIAVINTSGSYKDLDEVDSPLLLTKAELVYKDKENLIKIQRIPIRLKAQIEPEAVKEKVIRFVGFFWVLMLPILILLSFVYRFMQAILYAILGKCYSAMTGVSLRYVEVFKLSMVAVTPAIFFSTLIDWADWHFPFQWLFYFVLSMGYLIFAIRANK